MRRAATLFFLLFCAPASAAEELAASYGRIQADAYGGRIAWAALDPASGRWELVEYLDGRVRALPVDAFEAPVRLDLGPGPDGAVTAVYAREGRLHLYDFSSRKEKVLHEFETGNSLPTIWRGEVTFARRTAGRPELWRGRIGTGRLTKLPAGPVSGTSGPISTEMRGSRVVFAWSSRNGERTEVGLYEARGTRAVRLDRTSSGAMSTSTFVTPEILGSRVYYGRATMGSGTGNQLRRASLKKDRTVEAVRAPAAGLVTALYSGGAFLYSRVTGGAEAGMAECGMRADRPLSESICRLIRGDRVTGWTSIRSRVAH